MGDLSRTVALHHLKAAGALSSKSRYLALAEAELIGTLDDLAPRTSALPPILVRPFVFTLPARRPLILNPEVAGAWWLPVDALLSRGAEPVEFARYGTLVRTFGYRLEPGVLWGMTERILSSLLDLFPRGFSRS